MRAFGDRQAKVGYIGHTRDELVKHWEGVLGSADLIGAGMSARVCLFQWNKTIGLGSSPAGILVFGHNTLIGE